MVADQAQVHVVLAEDDEDDRVLLEDALKESVFAAKVYFVGDGEELLDFLHQRGRYAGRRGKPLPCLVLMDLNMPRKTGSEALSEIRADARLRHLPVVILTTSSSHDDITKNYAQGANSFITKPSSYDELVNMLNVLHRYWFGVVRLPFCP